jgi:alkanesulfonate monooxygenase
MYLMWPETEEKLRAHMVNMGQKAAGYGRKVDFGLRVHMIVRETEAEAKQAAKDLMKYIDDDKGTEIRERALDARSLGVAKQAEARAEADEDGFVEPHLWTGIGRARSGCGAAIVGDPDQVYAKIQRYMQTGIRGFIFSGYPHLDECKLFARYVLPRLQTFSMPELQGRRPNRLPNTPLGAGKRK